jgi:hypothetical protein
VITLGEKLKMKTNKLENITDEWPTTVDVSVDNDWLNYSGAGNPSVWTSGAADVNPIWNLGSSSGYTYTNTNITDLNSSGKISIKGENADLDINGVSLKDFMARVEQRLAILTPDPRLEEEWEELRVLGDRYRELEKEINAKMKTFDILKNE